MAGHTALWRNAIAAIRGDSSAKHLGVSGGSVNYRLMDDGTAYILDPSPDNLRVILGHFRNMLDTGHMSLSGPNGVATEQGTVGAHRKYNMAMVCGILIHAEKNVQKHINDLEELAHKKLADACRQTIYDECGFCLAFQYKPPKGPALTIAPAPRIKDDADKTVKGGHASKLQAPIDKNRDRFLSLATGKQIRARKEFWQDDAGNLDVILMNEMLRDGLWTVMDIQNCKLGKLPKLYLPIKTRLLFYVGGFEGWLVDTPEARRACGKDACHFVHAGINGVWWRYDWDDAGENNQNNHYWKGKDK